MKKNVFLVDNGIDVELLQKQIKNLPESVIYTLDYDIHKKLEKKRIIHNLAEDVLEKNDFHSYPEMPISEGNVFFLKSKSYLQNRHKMFQKSYV